MMNLLARLRHRASGKELLSLWSTEMTCVWTMSKEPQCPVFIRISAPEQQLCRCRYYKECLLRLDHRPVVSHTTMSVEHNTDSTTAASSLAMAIDTSVVRLNQPIIMVLQVALYIGSRSVQIASQPSTSGLAVIGIPVVR